MNIRSAVASLVRDYFRVGVISLGAFGFLLMPSMVLAATITVNSTGDSLTAADGNCDLSEAITNANNDTDGTGGDCASGSGTDNIVFNIGAGDAQTIAIANDIPAITSEVHIDGTTQPSTGSLASCSPRNLLISVDGQGNTQKIFYFLNGSQNSTVKGLNLYGTTVAGVDIATDNIRVTCNNIGTDLAGTAVSPNINQDSGIRFEGPATGNTIGGTGEAARNIISGNATVGIWLLSNTPGDVQNNTIQGNYIGTDVTGTSAVANGGNGLQLQEANNNFIGGSLAGQGNLISGNGQNGVFVGGNAGSDFNILKGNYIGTDATGIVAIPNFNSGVDVSKGSNNTFGTSVVGDRNIISGNNGNGMSLEEGSNNTVQNNYFGLGVGGGVLGNNFDGFAMNNGLPVLNANTIGGNRLSGEGNVFSGNGGNGMSTNHDTNSIIKGNIFGLDPTGNSKIPNGSSGLAPNTSSLAIIGSATAGEGNIFSGNNQDGLHFDFADNVVIKGNIIGTDITGTINLGNGNDGLLLANQSNNNTIGGSAAGERNIISGNGANGINLPDGDSNIIKGNYIGTDITGTLAFPNNFSGINISGGGGTRNNNVIGGNRTLGEGNLISGNNGGGLNVFDANSTIIKGNLIGLKFDGLSALPNLNGGLNLGGDDLTAIGGSIAGEGNVISGNGQMGIVLASSGPNPTTNSILFGNFIGTDINGVNAVPNQQSGIALATANNNQIGGPNAGERNIIAGNGTTPFSDSGIFILDGNNNQLLGNYIGVNVLGNALGQQGSGLQISGTGNQIGGNNPGEGNVISANKSVGIILLQLGPAPTSGNLIRGNFIGTDTSGNVASGFGNGNVGFGPIGGVALLFGAEDNVVGGTNPASKNIIAGNTGAGVMVYNLIPLGGTDPERNAILGNSIHDNTGIGIDQAENTTFPASVTPDINGGPNANDAGDPDVGPNDYLNYPIFTKIQDVAGGNAKIEYNLDVPAGNYRVEFFKNNAADSSGFGEGQTFIGSQNITHPGSGVESYSITVPGNTGNVISANVTQDLGAGNFGPTSEFSFDATVGTVPTPPVVPVSSPVSSGGGGSAAQYKLFGAALTSGQTQQTGTTQQTQQVTPAQQAGNCDRADKPFPFVDAENHWARIPIEYLYRRCVIDGKKARQFAPDDSISRAEVTKIVLKLFQLGTSDFKNVFADVHQGDWFATYVVQGAKLKILLGFVNNGVTEFRPNQPITRAEALKVLLVAKGVKVGNEKASYPDVHPSDWFYSYIAYASTNGIMNGYNDPKGGAKFFAPNQPITRAEFSKAAVMTFNPVAMSSLALGNDHSIRYPGVLGVRTSRWSSYFTKDFVLSMIQDVFRHFMAK